MERRRHHQLALFARNVGICYDLALARPRTLKQTAGALIRGRVRSHQHRPYWAIRHISLTLNRGEALGIIGRNGSGKSTLLLALAGVLQPDEGFLATYGSPSLLTLGAGFDPELTGRQNIHLNGAYLGLSRRRLEARLEEIIEFSELGEFIDAPLRQYSTGMRARLGFAIASHIRPDILLFDEVFSVGDPTFQEKSRAKLESLMETSSSIIVVSHDPGFLMRTCSRVAWLEGGALAEIGDAEPVLDRYREHLAQPQAAPLRALQ